MPVTHIPTPEEVLSLLKKSGDLPLDNNAFLSAFKTLYPALNDLQRSELLQSLLIYVDSLLQASNAKAA